MPLSAQFTGSPSHGPTRKTSRKILPTIHVVDLIRPSRRLPPITTQQLTGHPYHTQVQSCRQHLQTLSGLREVQGTYDIDKKATLEHISHGRSVKVDKTMSTNDILVKGHPTWVEGSKYDPAITRQTEAVSSRAAYADDLNSRLVASYLKQNEKFLDDYVRSNISRAKVKSWLGDRPPHDSDGSEHTDTGSRSPESGIGSGEISSTGAGSENTLSDSSRKENAVAAWKKLFSNIIKRRLLENITENVTHASCVGQVLEQLASRVATAVDADGYYVYTVDPQNQAVRLHAGERDLVQTDPCTEELTRLPIFVARSRQIIRITAQHKDSKPPSTHFTREGKACHVLCGPMINSAEQVVGVTELYRASDRPTFTDQDEQISSSLLLLSDLLLKCHELNENMLNQKKLNEFLLMVTKSIFQDIVSMDTVILKIMKFAQQFLQADRTSFFFLNRRNRELFSRVFDVDASTTIERLAPESISIRFSTSKGVAGYVAATGKTLNILDAYQDDRFNREVDRQTGYTTKTILCMPIYIKRKVIGVVQMINKLNGVFTRQDEEAFEMFAVYCSLALHQAKLYEKMRRSEQKNKVALEVLSYHSQASEAEVLKLKNSAVPSNIPELLHFSFSPWSVPYDDKPVYVLYMLKEMFTAARYDVESLCRFTLTVRKNYRDVPYHNWSHAFSVAQSMYAITKLSSLRLTHLEKLALFVSCLCHDVDHRGYTNQFMITSCSPIASLYTTSTMEHHHFNQTVTILQHEGHNIFRYLTSEEYKQLLSCVKHFILSTDLAVFFQNKGRLKALIDENSFDWNISDHRLLGFSIAMTACDLCSSSKPWEVQMKTVQVIFEEFYAQGDKEKLQGKTPIAMMDRDKAEQLPTSQVGFLVGICIPCYELLVQIIPETKPMLEGTRCNLARWQEKAETVQRRDVQCS